MSFVKHHIERCIAKSGQQLVAEDILELPGLIIGYGKHHSSWSYRPEGETMHIYHFFGSWDANGAQYIREVRNDMSRFGCERFSWNGRPGWARFLRIKGVLI